MMIWLFVNLLAHHIRNSFVSVYRKRKVLHVSFISKCFSMLEYIYITIFFHKTQQKYGPFCNNLKLFRQMDFLFDILHQQAGYSQFH